MNERFIAHVVQYLRPNRRRRDTLTDLPLSCKPAYDEMVAAGYRLEAEVLTTGEASITISVPHKSVDVDIVIMPNGPGLQEAIAAMLERKMWRIDLQAGS